MAWYRDHREALKVEAKPADEPKELARRWREYWAKPGTEKQPEAGKHKQGDGK